MVYQRFTPARLVNFMVINLNPSTTLATTSPETKPVAADNAELRASAEEFEAAFVRQMLQYAGFAEAFGAQEGASAEALSSFLLDHLATEIAGQGAFGLADSFYEKLAAAQAEAGPVTGKKL